MIQYTASELVKRAFNLADLGNTDFISFREQIQYANDAWTEVYNYIIDKGDKQFVRETILNGTSVGAYTEYELPWDLYKICSIKDKYSGVLINRATESSSLTSGTYDIINNKLRLNGVGCGNLVMTYWIVPLTITFPDRAHAVDTSDIISIGKNSALYSDGTIKNLITGEELGSIEDIDVDASYILGNGHVCKYSSNSIYYYDFNGVEIAGYNFGTRTINIVRDSHWNVMYAVNGKLYLLDKEIATLPSRATYFGEDSFIVYLNGDLFYKYGSGWYLNDTFYDNLTLDNVRPAPDFDGRKSVYATKDGKAYRLLLNPDDTIIFEEISQNELMMIGFSEYGPIYSNGTFSTLYSGVPDTDMNFPSEIYFSLIAANLAVRFLMKQNADSAGMNSIYENMLSTYRNSQSQHSEYSVVSNAYY